MRRRERLRLRDLKCFRVFSNKIDIPERFFLLFFFLLEKLAVLSLLKEVKPSPDRKMIKLLIFNNLLPPLLRSR